MTMAKKTYKKSIGSRQVCNAMLRETKLAVKEGEWGVCASMIDAARALKNVGMPADCVEDLRIVCQEDEYAFGPKMGAGGRRQALRTLRSKRRG